MYNKTRPHGIGQASGGWRPSVGKVLVLLLMLGLLMSTQTPWAFASQNYSFVLKWGTMGTGEGQFQGPMDVAVDSNDNVYVVDRGNGRIQVFDTNGNFLRKWGSIGGLDGQFSMVNAIAIDSADNVYVADTNNHRIQVFDSNGNFVRKWGTWTSGGDSQMYEPTGIAVLKSNGTEYVYVVDKTLDRVQKFDTNGNFIVKWGHNGFTNGLFWEPLVVEADPTGTYVYVGDSQNGRIQRFMYNGNYNFQWGSKGSGNGDFASTTGIAIDAWGDVYVADNVTIQKFDANGTFITRWGGTNPPSDSFGTGDGQFKYPQGVAVDSNGYVYVADINNHRIQKFSNGVLPVGTDVVLETAHVQLAFDEVTGGGEVTVRPWRESLPLPVGKTMLAQWDISTSAIYDTTGGKYIYVTFPYTYSGDPSNLKVYHGEGGAWVDRTASIDTVNHTITARVTSLSPFGIGGPDEHVPFTSKWGLEALGLLGLGALFLALRRRTATA